jgi:hypothetical protein
MIILVVGFILFIGFILGVLDQSLFWACLMSFILGWKLAELRNRK